MKLIHEVNYNVQQTHTISESTGKKRWYIEGVFAEQEQKNRNGRIYPSSTMEREMRKYQKVIKEHQAIGELNHPNYPSPEVKLACHRVVELHQQGNDWHGKSLLLAGTEWGDHTIALLDNECKLGVSTRGVGSLKVDEARRVAIVQDDYGLNCWDVVVNPSANKAFVNGIMEGSDWAWDNGILIESAAANIFKEASKGSKADPLIVEMTINQYSKLMRGDSGLDTVPIRNNLKFVV